MKNLIALILLLIALPAKADTELGVTHLQIHQDLFNTINFRMDAIAISGTYWGESNFGIRVEAARSTETANHLYVENKFYTNKINSMYSILAMYRVEVVEDYSVNLGFGKTDYKSTWKVNDELPSWADGTDSDWSYHMEGVYDYGQSMSMKVGYADYYRKHKKGYGKEETTSLYFGFLYRF